MKQMGLIFALLLGGCQFCDRYIISEPGKNEIIRVNNGDRYYFELEENVTTGYSWDYACDNADVEVIIDHEGPSETEKDGRMMCGAPGKASVCVRIHRGFDGPAGVRFFYKRPWEKEPIKQFTLSFYRRTGDVAFWK